MRDEHPPEDRTDGRYEWFEGRYMKVLNAERAGWFRFHNRWHDRNAAPPQLAAVPRTTPEGWQLVPVEPTEEMLEAGDFVCAQLCDHGGSMSRIWEAMLSAAPRTEREGLKLAAPYHRGCQARDIPGATCQIPNCDCAYVAKNQTEKE